jgi:hypothetical protein
LQKNHVIQQYLCIDGDFNDKWERGNIKAAISVNSGITIAVQKGQLVLRSLRLERRLDGEPLIQSGKDGRLEIENCGITLSGSFLAVKNGQCTIRDSSLIALMSSETRIPAIQIADSQISIDRTQVRIEGANGLFMEMKGGVLEIENSEFSLDCLRTGTVFNLDGVSADFNNLKVSGAAGDYCSGIEISGSKFTMKGGAVSVSARNAAGIISDTTESLYIGTSFTLKAAFAGKVFTIRNIFPKISGCDFVFSGTSRRSEIFSAEPKQRGDPPLVPESGSIAGNVFRGFTHILGEDWPMESLAGFNRSYASLQRPNTQRVK